MQLIPAVFFALNKIFDIMYWLVFARVIMSWLPFNYNNQFMYKLTSVIYSLTEPIMGPIRNMLSKTALGRTPLDFSPFVALIALQIVQRIVAYLFVAILSRI